MAFLLSFLIVGIIWLNHHATFNLLRRTDHTVQVLNLLLLLPVTVLPWPTALLAEYTREGTAGDQRLAVLVYGATSTAMALSFNVLWRYLRAPPRAAQASRHDRAPRCPQPPLQPRARGLPRGHRHRAVSVPLFLVLMLGLALVYLLPTPDVRA